MIGKTMGSSLGKLRLRTTLVVPFIIQIIAAVGLVGLIVNRSGQQAVNDVASQLRTELTNRITEKLTTYTAAPKTINRLNASAVAQGDLDILTPRGEYLFWEQMQIYPTLSYVYCGDEQGAFFGVSRASEADGGQVILHFSNATTNFIRQDFGFDPQGNRAAQIGTLDQPYDPRARPWYQAAKATQQAVWSDVYLAFATGFPTITASMPVYDRQDNQLIGVCATDFFLPREVNHFLKNLQIGKTGTAFIMERSGQLIATSSEEPMVAERGGASERLLATASPNATIQATAEHLTRRFRELDQIQSIQQLDFTLDGEPHYVQAMPFQDDNLDWLVVLAIPESDFMAQIHESRRNAVALALVALGVAITIGILTARWVTLPLLRLSQASNELAEGQLEQPVNPSPIIEIDTLAASFNGMAAQLKESFDALRLAEENYRSIFENALEGIFQSSPTGEFISANPALARIYGYDSPGEMIASVTNIGKQLYVDPEKRAEFRTLLTKQDAVKNFEYRCYCKDGGMVWVEVDARVVKDSRGQVLYYEGIVQDISDRKRREEQLRKQLAELQIEIDHKKREQEVAMLTESNYFQEVQQEVAEINLDEFWS
ncbi:PAS domain S-box protein [Synechococcales cyanobacterium C]|uniref:histidine kinase n=2 Tax=Petrachloros TaxID=2918834 RepID=A0A8K2A019_9CYAN|nr:PAS domain S-box protein [Petrachloros mirabilis ULC683]